MDNIIGKRAYKKTGFLAKLVGIIDHKDEQFHNSYIIKFSNNTGVMASLDDMVILEDKK